MAITLTRAAGQDELRYPEFIGLSTDGYPSSDDPAVVNGAEVYFMDIQTRYKYAKGEDVWYEVPEGGGNDNQGVLVKVVDQNDTMPTTRSDGSPLENEDYVKPKPTATFPFTINGVTFENKFTKAIYFNNEWILDVGLIQDTSETPLATPALEKWETERGNQKQLNLDILDQLKNEIIYYNNLNNVPADKLYKRLYKQTLDTADREAGVYYYNFDSTEADKWETLGGGSIKAGNTLPSGKRDGDLFILLSDVGTGSTKVKKGLYRFNGNLWVHIAHTEPWTSEIEVKDETAESISKTATTQEAINKENALIIGQEKDIDVDEEVDLIGAVNWLNENKTAKKRLTLKSFADPAKPYAILDGEEELDYTHLKALINSSKYAVELVDRATVLHPCNNVNINDAIDFVATFRDEDPFFSMMCYVVSMREDGYIKTSFVNLENTYYKMQDFTSYQPEFDTDGKNYASAQAVYKQLIKETEFEFDETGAKDKLTFKVTNNNDDDIIDEEIEIDKVLIRVDSLPDANVNVSRFYLLTADTAAYDAGVYYATIVDDEVIWTKVSGDDEQGGILVATVKQGDTMPTTRPDGTDLQNEDYVKPQPTATFPFTIDDITFENKFTKAIYFNDGWIIDAGLIQDTSETPVVDKTLESYDGTATTQKAINTQVADIIGKDKTLETIDQTIIGAINELNRIETYHFIGYVSKTAPTGTLKEGQLWYNGEEMPEEFPINVKEYKEGAWVDSATQYNPTSLDLWANLENDHGYYWYGNHWNLVDIDIEVDGETIDFNDAGQIKVADEAIKNKHINPELKATVIEADDDDQLATEGAVYGELVKETTLELDETGVKDKLILKVTNNSDTDIVDKELEFDKVIIRVTAFPTENVNFSHLYLLTEDTDDYDAGLYYAVQDGDNIVWTKAGANEGIIYVDALPDTDVDTQVFYYLKAKVDDFEAGLYYAVLKEDGTYKWHYLEESGIVAVEDEDTGVITFENGNATPYEAILPVDTLPTTNVQTGHFYRLKADVGDYKAGMYYAVKNDDGTYAWVQDGASITDQIKIVKYFKNYDSQVGTDGIQPGEYKRFEISIGLEGYEPVAILNPRSAQSIYNDKTRDTDQMNNAAEIVVGNVKFKENDTSKVIGAFVNMTPKNIVAHYMDIAFDVMYFKKA